MKETRRYSAEQVRGIDTKNRQVTVIISTDDIDSHGTRIDQNGWDFSIFNDNPVIPLAHDDRGFTGSNGLPVAKGLPETLRTDKQVTYLTIEFPPAGVFELADTVYELVRNGFLNAVSVGFEALDWKDEEEEVGNGEFRTVRVFKKQRLLEVSIVTIPSNSKALVQRARKLDKEDEIERYRTLAKQIESYESAGDPIRWNRSLSEKFDVADAELSPSKIEYEWVAKFIGCDVKKIYHNVDSVPSARLGSFLSGLQHVTEEHTLDDVRNITDFGEEEPPQYEAIQLNSRTRRDFLVKGISFYTGPEGRFAVKVQPTWFGTAVDVYTSVEQKDFNHEILDRTWEWARQNNFLRGEAFSLSGEFVRKTDDSWDDVFLEEKNQKPLQRSVELINQKGKSMPNRGIIMTGPPGTGKTLSGRIMRNTADATFIWVSARDFARSGAFGGMSYAFELARELSPSILFIEDIDNWMNPYTVDLLKTEMDGLSRSSGVVTMLTTNFPESLPEALIDRPGRFHDVLHITHPAAEKRAAMIRKWVDDIGDEDVNFIVEKTAGYSGAHMFELASYIRTIVESDELPLGEAVREAVRKVEEQKELITQLQLSGSTHRPRRMNGMRLETGCATVSRMKPEIQSKVIDVRTEDMESFTRWVEQMQGQVEDITADFEQYKKYFEDKQPSNKVSFKVLEKFFSSRGMTQPSDLQEAWETMHRIMEEEEQEEKPEEPTNPQVEAAPQPEQKVSVQVSVSEALEFSQKHYQQLTDVAVAALRKGLPMSDALALIDGVNDSVVNSITTISTHGKRQED